MRVAAANSALIGAYYAVIAAKLGGACATFAFSGSASGGSVFLFPVALAAVLALCFLILRGGQRALSISGKISVGLSLTAFFSLAVTGIIRGGAFASFSFSPLKGGAIWTDALGQALLALSLAGGVMPTFARAQNPSFKPLRAAVVIISANFSGCLLSVFATLPFIGGFSQAGAVECALNLFPQIVFAVAKTEEGVKVFGSLFYTVLSIVAVHSLCSLATPLISQVKYKVKSAPALFCLFSFISAFAFSACNMQILSACDQTACSVNAVIIALAECVFFSSLRHIRGVIGVFIRIICPATCLILAIFSVCGARYGVYPAVCNACAAACFAVVFARAIPLSRLTFLVNKLKIKCRKNVKTKQQ